MNRKFIFRAPLIGLPAFDVKLGVSFCDKLFSDSLQTKHVIDSRKAVYHESVLLSKHTTLCRTTRNCFQNTKMFVFSTLFSDAPKFNLDIDFNQNIGTLVSCIIS